MPEVVGRNDPCPCGSGKKYKNCCMRQKSYGASRELSLGTLEAYLINELYQYAQTTLYAGDLLEGAALYWGGTYDFDNLAQGIDAEDTRRMFEWFVYDYHTASGRRYLIDLYTETRPSDFPAAAKEVLAAWQKSVCGLYRVVGIEPGERLELYDPLRQENLSIQDEVLARSAQKGDLLIGRLFAMGDAKRLSYMTMLLPAMHEADLVAYLTNAYNRYASDHFQASWDEFLRENGHIFNAFMLSTKANALRRYIGPGTRYHDPAIARDKLQELTRQHAAERAREQAKAEEEERPEHRTSTGIILPGMAEEEAAAPKGGEKPAAPTILIPGRDF